MGRPAKDRRVGTGKKVIGPMPLRIHIAGQSESIAKYGERLYENFELASIRAETLSKSDDLGAHTPIAKQIACGRILSVSEHRNVERTFYCGLPSKCDCCRHIDARRRAKHVYRDSIQERKGRLLHVICTLPTATTAAETKKKMEFAKATLPKLKRAVRRLVKCDKLFPTWAVGLHAPFNLEQKTFTPHLHYVLFVPTGITHRYASSELGRIWKQAASEDLGVEALVLTPRAARRTIAGKKTSGRWIAPDHAINLFAYVQRLPEDKDSPQTVFRREKLLKDSDFKRHFWMSQSQSTPRKISSRSTFDPVALGKKHLIVFPLDGPPFAESCERYEELKGQIIDEAIGFVQSATKSSEN